jgi:hypothetical protein
MPSASMAGIAGHSPTDETAGSLGTKCDCSFHRGLQKRKPWRPAEYLRSLSHKVLGPNGRAATERRSEEVILPLPFGPGTPSGHFLDDHSLAGRVGDVVIPLPFYDSVTLAYKQTGRVHNFIKYCTW